MIFHVMNDKWSMLYEIYAGQVMKSMFGSFDKWNEKSSNERS